MSVRNLTQFINANRIRDYPDRPNVLLPNPAPHQPAPEPAAPAPNPGAPAPQAVGIPERERDLINEEDKLSVDDEDEETFDPNLISHLRDKSINVDLYARFGRDAHGKRHTVALRYLFRMDIKQNAMIYTCLRDCRLNEILTPDMYFYLPIPTSLNYVEDEKEFDMTTSNLNYIYKYAKRKERLICDKQFDESTGRPQNMVDIFPEHLYNKWFLKIIVKGFTRFEPGFEIIIEKKDIAPKTLPEQIKPKEKEEEKQASPSSKKQRKNDDDDD